MWFSICVLALVVSLLALCCRVERLECDLRDVRSKIASRDPVVPDEVEAPARNGRTYPKSVWEKENGRRHGSED